MSPPAWTRRLPRRREHPWRPWRARSTRARQRTDPSSSRARRDGTDNDEDADETKAEDAVALTTSAAEDDAVGPLEAWGETKEPEKEEKKLHQCVFDTNRKLGLHLKRGDDGRAVVTKVDEEGQAAAGRLKAGYILATFDDEPCDEYDLFLECFAGAKEHQALIRLGFEKVKTPKENDESRLWWKPSAKSKKQLSNGPPQRKRDMLARKIKDRLRMLDAEADGDEAGDAAFAAYMARERHEADAKLKSLQEAWRKESNAKDRSTNRRVAELKAENDRLRGLYSATQVKELPTDKVWPRSRKRGPSWSGSGRSSRVNRGVRGFGLMRNSKSKIRWGEPTSRRRPPRPRRTRPPPRPSRPGTAGTRRRGRSCWTRPR